MPIYKGTTLLSGISTNTISNANNLLDWKPSDHIINSMEWLRADTFSWQSGDVYIAAYNHLVADVSSGTSQTETVGSYTITYTLATDGHKITTDETTVTNIYNETGIAWYYVLDTTNTRFKLPRSSHGDIVEKIKDGSNWCKVYSDGWCVQGGFVNTTATPTTISLLRSYVDTTYSILLTGAYNGNAYPATSNFEVGTDSFQVRTPNANVDFYWQTKGYINNSLTNDQYKYIYFYVGPYSQSATEQTAGLNSALFNGKLDLDLGNITTSAKSTFVGWGTPDYSSYYETQLTTTTVTKASQVSVIGQIPAYQQAYLYDNNNVLLVGVSNETNSAVYAQSGNAIVDAGTTIVATGFNSNTVTIRITPLKGA